MSSKTNRTVVRNKAYNIGSFTTCDRHNERKNDSYFNGDIDPERKGLNVYFHHDNNKFDEPNNIVVAENYEETFNRMIDEGTIIKRGLKADAKVFDELIFDVNSAYFEEHGGYEYAKSFFEEAYKYAVKEVGRQYIISAVMHADERNKVLSEQLGRDVYHYHLHVVYVPVVEKEILWSKRTKDKSLVGKVKEVIPQISHSKKWPMRVPVERNGKTVQLNSYSLLQDRFFEHMREAGFEGFERGERGSAAEHLDVLDYKIQQDTIRAEAAAALADSKEKQAAVLDKKVEKSQKQLDGLNEKTAASEKVVAELEEIEKLGHKRTIFGAVTVPDKWWQKILNLVKEAFKYRKEIKELRAEVKTLKSEVKLAKEAFEEQKAAYSRLVERVQPYLNAVKLFPQQVKDTLAHIIEMGRKQHDEQQKTIQPTPQITKTKSKSRTEER